LRLVGSIKLDDFKREHSLARKVIDAWIMEVQHARWSTPQDVKSRYRSVDFLAENRVIFDLKGNSFRLVAKIDYGREMVMIEWIGTHAAYDKMKFG
jgi:mRNA interferase HigB